VFVIIGGWLIIKILGYPPDKVHAISLLFPSIIFFTFIQSFNAVFQATEKMIFIPLGKAIDGLILIGGAYLLIHFKTGSNSFILLYTIAVFSVFIFSFTIAWKKFTHFTVTYERQYLKQILKDASPFAIGMIFSTFYYWNSSAFLSLWRGDAETGLFTAPLRLVLGTTFIPTAFVGSIYPILSRTFISSKEKLENILERALKYMLILVVPLCFFTMLSAQKIIQFFYGANYLPSASLLMVLIWWAGLIYLNAILAHFFYSTNKQSVIAIQTFFAATLNIILNILFIRNFGALGASIAIVSAEFLSFIYLLYKTLSLSSSYKITLSKLLQTLLKSVLAFIPPFVFILVGKKLNLIILGFSVLILYFVSLCGIKGFSSSDIKMAKDLWADLKLIIYGRY
jgi:O-antigen/teichoic acid export membrane protein